MRFQKKGHCLDTTKYFSMQARHIHIGGKQTTIALEQAFWREADIQAGKVGQSWQQWAEYLLESRPASIGKARWLRVHLLREGGTC